MGQDQQTTTTATPSTLTSTAITSLAALKIGLGAACVIAPQLTCDLFLLSLPPQAAIAVRLFGSSCAAVGAITLRLNKKCSEGKLNKSDMKMVAGFNILADMVDTASSVVGYSSGMYGLGALGMLGGGGVVLAALGAVGYRGL
ncbi:hypothetical protein BGZ63DRAFT_427093 [Mariannaea sp. PMI_226]|nr:hypothetical protein BGZ63DRAFT_427093 [Mariannaea sp. PMI_226]